MDVFIVLLRCVGAALPRGGLSSILAYSQSATQNNVGCQDSTTVAGYHEREKRLNTSLRTCSVKRLAKLLVQFGPHFVPFKKATRSASSCFVNCVSRPPGITET